MTRTYKDIAGAEENDLVRRYQAGDKAAGETLLRAHAGLIESVAGPYLRRATCDAQRDDIRQEARIGFLLHGVAKYDPEHAAGACLATYSRNWIWQRIVRFLNNTRGTTHTPYRLQRAMRKARDAGEWSLIRPDLESLAFGALSLDMPLHESDHPIAESVRAEGDPEAAVGDAEAQRVRRAMVRAAIGRANLSPIQADIFERRYMLDEPETLEAIGAVYGVTRERIRQIAAEAYGKVQRSVLRREEEAEGLPEYVPAVPVPKRVPRCQRKKAA